MKQIIVLYFFLLYCTCNNIYCSNNILTGASCQIDGKSMALGGGMIGIEQSDSTAIFLNCQLPYNLSELSTKSIKLTTPTKWMKLDVFYAQTGDAVFLENYLSLGASRCLSGSFMLGIKAGYYHYSLISDEKGGTLLSEINCSYKLYEDFEIDIYIFNPTGSKIDKGENAIPLYQSFHIGGLFSTTEKAVWLFEIEKVQQENIIWHLGFEYAVWDTFILRTGLSANPLKPSWGIGGKFHRLKYSLGGNVHPVLGLSSCFTIGYNW
ncbi:MAG: hypothetical protein M0P26_02895 [Bacteroidales bacterium]|nr:hypothetical protein [Bacteroidales bacterium]